MFTVLIGERKSGDDHGIRVEHEPGSDYWRCGRGACRFDLYSVSAVLYVRLHSCFGCSILRDIIRKQWLRSWDGPNNDDTQTRRDSDGNIDDDYATTSARSDSVISLPAMLMNSHVSD